MTADAADGAAERVRTLAAVVMVVAGSVALLAVAVRPLVTDWVDQRLVDDLHDEVEDLRAHLATLEPAAVTDPDQVVADAVRSYVQQRRPSGGRTLIGVDDQGLLVEAPTGGADRLVTFDRADAWAETDEPSWGWIDDGVGRYRIVAVPVGESVTFVAAGDVDRQRSWVMTVFNLVAAGAVVVAVLAAAVWVTAIRHGRRRAAAPVGPAALEPGGLAEVSPDRRLVLVDARDLVAELIRRARELRPTTSWRTRNLADGDLVCDPDELFDTLQPHLRRDAAMGRLGAVGHAGGVSFWVDDGVVDPARVESDVLEHSDPSRPMVAETAAGTTRVVVWVPRRPSTVTEPASPVETTAH